jgi:hypothetical protein
MKSKDLAALESSGPEQPHPGPLPTGEGVARATMALKRNRISSLDLRRESVNCGSSPSEEGRVRVLRSAI